MRDEEISHYAVIYLLLRFLSAIDVVIHLVFIVMETPQHYRKVIEVPCECKLVFC